MRNGKKSLIFITNKRKISIGTTKRSILASGIGLINYIKNNNGDTMALY